MSSQTAVLLIHDGREVSPFLLRRLRACGLDVHVAAQQRLHQGADGGFVYEDPDQLADLALAHAMRHRIRYAAVGTVTEPRVRLAAEVAAQIGLPGPSAAAVASTSIDKVAMRDRLAAAGVAVPRHHTLTLLEDVALAAAVGQLGGRAVLKPRAGEASVGVVLAEASRVAGAVAAARASVAAARADGIAVDDSAWIVEEYVPGVLVSVDGVTLDGEVQVFGVVETALGPEPQFTLEANWLPARIGPELERAARGAAVAAVAAVGLERAAFHCELRLDSSGFKVLELAARLPGGQIPPAYLRALGIDIAAAQAALWLGRPLDVAPSRRIQVVQRGVFPRGPGVVRRARGFRRAAGIAGVWDFAGLARAGRPVITHPDVPVPLYYYATEGLDVGHAEMVARRAEAAVDVVVEQQPCE